MICNLIKSHNFFKFGKKRNEKKLGQKLNLIIKYFSLFHIFLNHFSRLCRSLEECNTVRDNGTLLYRPYQPMIHN